MSSPRARDVLIVEDDADARQSIVDVMRDEGCRVYEATDGQDALRVLRLIIPDLIVTDLMMPGLNGWDLCEVVRRDRRLRNTRIAVVSAVAHIQPIEGARTLPKPLDARALASLLVA